MCVLLMPRIKKQYKNQLSKKNIQGFRWFLERYLKTNTQKKKKSQLHYYFITNFIKRLYYKKIMSKTFKTQNFP